MARRVDIKPKFQTDDIPKQVDFYEVFDSFVNKEDDKATIDMIDAGIDDEHYVTPALLRVGLQNAGVIAGGSNLPYKQHEDNFNASFINLDREPIESSVKVFKNGQLLLEGEDYTINYEDAIVTFPESVGGRNIEIDYWYRSLDPIPGNGTNYVDLTTNQTIGGDKTFTGSVQVPNATLSTEAVNKGQLDAAVLGGGGGATPTFQQVLDMEGEYPGGQASRGIYSYIALLQEDLDGNVSSDIRSTTPDFSKISYLSLYHNQAGLDHIINNGQPNSIAGSVTILEGKPSISQEESSGKTTLQFESPTADTTIKIPAKPAGTYTIATLDDITGGSTNLTTTYSPTTVTIESSNGTDAVVNAVDVTNAGVVTPGQKADWDGKQDALGFTPYNATNPANYQTNVDVANTIGDFISDEAYNATTWNAVSDDAPSKNSVRDKFVSVDSDIALKANLNSPTFTGSVQVPNGSLSTEAVNKGQLDAVASAVQEYKTYFINTATGNNATGVYQDASKPFASIDYVNTNFTITDGTIFYLQGTGQTYLINNQLQAKKQSIIADEGSTNILDFSSNTNASAMVTGGSNNVVTIKMPNGVLRCERSGGTGVHFSVYTSSAVVSINVREIYWNTSTAMTSNANNSLCEIKADKISCRNPLTQGITNDIIIKEFVCLGSNVNLGQYLKNVRINFITGTGSYMIQSEIGVKYTIGNVTATGGLLFNTGISEFDITFDNSTITSFALGATSTLKTLRGTIKSITTISGSINSTKFINFTANLGTGNMTLGASNATVSFENCSIKSTNSPIIITAGAFSNVLELKNSAFEVVNAVPLITGGAGGTNTVKVDGLSHNATTLSDQNGTGVTVNVIGKQSVADGVAPKDAVNKGQLDIASQWTKTGNDIQNNNTGLVKIGTSTPNTYPPSFKISGGLESNERLYATGFQTGNGSGLFRGATAENNLYRSNGPATGVNHSFTNLNTELATSGIKSNIDTPLNFAPTSGTGVFNDINLNPTINQTGGANGITRALYINPTLTSAVDFRAIEVVNGKVIIPNGSASNEAVNKGQLDNRPVVETTSGYTLTNADSGGLIVFKTTAAQTLTIPTGLADGFECTFVTLAGVTLTVVSTGNTLNNNVGSTMLPKLSFTLKRLIATNTFLATGNL